MRLRVRFCNCGHLFFLWAFFVRPCPVCASGRYSAAACGLDSATSFFVLLRALLVGVLLWALAAAAQRVLSALVLLVALPFHARCQLCSSRGAW